MSPVNSLINGYYYRFLTLNVAGVHYFIRPLGIRVIVIDATSGRTLFAAL